jgi:predicted MFS family arabinose efflux permease
MKTNSSTLEPSVAERWYTLFLLTLVYVLNVADRFVVSTLIEPIKNDLQLSDTSVAFLTGFALAIFYVTMGLPIAVYADRTNRRNVVALALGIWSLMTALCGAAQGYWQLLFARIGVGFGEAGGTPPSHSIISDMFPWNQRAMAFTIFALGSSLGSMLGSASGYISDAIGWRMVFFIFGVPGILVALVVRFSLREPQRGALDVRKTEGVPFKDTLRFMFKGDTQRHCLIGILLFAIWGYGLMWWAPTFLIRSFGLSVGEAGGTLLPIHGIGGTLSLVLTAWLMSKIGKQDPRLYPRFIAIVILLGTVPSIIAINTDSFALSRVMLWIFIPFVYAAVGPFFSLIQNLSPAGARSQAIAIGLFIANIGNLILAPQGVGILSDLLAPEYGRESLRLALLPVSCFGFWAAWHFWIAGRTIVTDMQNAGTLDEVEVKV